MPDVASNLRIIAVCGISEIGGKDAPNEDGWFFSDFFLFNRLLKWEGSSRTWLCSAGCTPDQLMNRWRGQEYLHGNPWETRKVVLNKSVLRNHRLTDITGVDQEHLLDTFLNRVSKECEITRQYEESVVILVFGHGSIDGKGIEIGKPRPDAIHKRLCYEALWDVAEGLPVTLLTTACFTGG